MSSSGALKRGKLSLRQLQFFIIAFVIIGSVIILKSFAASPCGTYSVTKGDFDCSTKVDITDLSYLLSRYNTSDPSADTNADNTVNINDLSVLLSNYNTTVIQSNLPAPSGTLKIYKAHDFMNSIAQNTHPDYGPGTYTTGNAYQLYTPGYGANSNEPVDHTWKKWACDSGIKVMRAGMKPLGWGPNDFGLYQVNDLYRTCGIRFILGVGDPDNWQNNLPNLPTYDRGAIYAIENSNEADNPDFYWGRCQGVSGHCTVAEWAQNVRNETKGVHDWLKANGYSNVATIAPSFINANIWWDASIPDATKVGDLSAWIDYGNWHPYSGGNTPESAVANGKNNAAINAPGKPVWFTEWGFHTCACSGPHPGVSESVQASYLLRGWADNFAQGVQASAAYEFLDQYYDTNTWGENYFGSIRRDYSPKPAFTAVKKLLSDVDDTSATFTPIPADLTVTAPNGVEVRSLVLEKTNGRMSILLWRPDSLWNYSNLTPISVSPQSVNVSLYRPDIATNMYADMDTPEVLGSSIAASSYVTNVNGWRTWNNISLDGRLVVLNVRY
jgi:hypothetical protein